MKKSVQDMEPNKDGVIREDFLSQDVQRSFERMEHITMALTDEANAVLHSVKDIVNICDIDDGEFLDKVQHAKKMNRQTIEKLHAFDLHNTAKLEPIHQDIRMMKNYISQIRELGNNGKLRIDRYQARQLDDQKFHKALIRGIKTKAARNALELEVILGEAGKFLLSQHLPAAKMLISYLQKRFDSKTMDYSYRAIHAATAASGDRLTTGEFSTIEHQVVSKVKISDHKKEWHGVYYTLIDGRKVREFKESDGSVTYELVSSIPDDRRQNAFQKSAQAFQEIGSDVLKAAEDRNEAKFDSFYDFGNYITFGALNTGQDFSKGLQVRAENMLNTPKDFVNWLTVGGVDMMHGTISPEETYSKEHWLSSFGLFSTVVGTKSFLSKPKSGSKFADQNDVGEVISKNNTYTRSSLKIPTMLNIKEWMRTQIPKVNVVNDTTGGYHYTVSKGSSDLKKNNNNLKIEKGIYKANPNDNGYQQHTVERVKGTGKYNTGTIKHIYHGEINRRGKAVGYHHESMMGGKIIPGTEKAPDKNGVYEAKVEIDGKRKVAKSSFFPREWNRVDVLKAIDEAYQNKKQIGSNKYIGDTSSGIKIEMFLNKDGSIATAYPLYHK